jgi:hypothetical protein
MSTRTLIRRPESFTNARARPDPPAPLTADLSGSVADLNGTPTIAGRGFQSERSHGDRVRPGPRSPGRHGNVSRPRHSAGCQRTTRGEWSRWRPRSGPTPSVATILARLQSGGGEATGPDWPADWPAPPPSAWLSRPRSRRSSRHVISESAAGTGRGFGCLLGHKRGLLVAALDAAITPFRGASLPQGGWCGPGHDADAR